MNRNLCIGDTQLSPVLSRSMLCRHGMFDNLAKLGSADRDRFAQTLCHAGSYRKAMDIGASLSNGEQPIYELDMRC